MFRAALLVLVMSAAFFTGCRGSGPEVVEIEGTVTHNGKPVPNLMIYFVPENGRPSWGRSDEQGRFVLDYDYDFDGAKVGKHTVYVMDANNMDPTARPVGGSKKSPEMAAVLAKYGKLETSPMKVEIKSADKNFQLKLD